ncbi:MAG: cation diffusion facilitator family transporter [Chloroflexota bacterium]
MNHTNDIQRVLVITLILNIAVAFGKIVVGMAAGALAIVADGFHSLMDGAGNIAALVANAIASRPPDDDHPYGHHRFENIGALVIGVLLLVTAWEVVQSVVARLFGEGGTPQITPLTIGVLVGTLAVNIVVSTYQRREGRRLRSQLLLADAENTRADVYVTLSVLGSTGFVLLGAAWMDTLAALVVVGLIVRAAWRVLGSAGGVLVDTAPYSPDQLQAWVCDLPDVHRVVRARSRGTADAAHIDIDVQVHPTTTIAQAENVTGAIRAQVEQCVYDCGGNVAEIEVHYSPARATAEMLAV